MSKRLDKPYRGGRSENWQVVLTQKAAHRVWMIKTTLFGNYDECEMKEQLAANLRPEPD